jgi:Na+-transporting methylmalonyl-CoA/oxaloacetate decarboxylase gamma subunit
MPVLIIAVVFLVLFFIMGVMAVTAVASERRFQREVDDYKRASGISEERGNESVKLKSVAAGAAKG